MVRGYVPLKPLAYSPGGSLLVATPKDNLIYREDWLPRTDRLMDGAPGLLDSRTSRMVGWLVIIITLIQALFFS